MLTSTWTLDVWTYADVVRLRAAAARDDVQALATLAVFYQDGLSDRRNREVRLLVRKNARAARRCLERAVQLGDPAAMCLLADLITGDDVGEPHKIPRRAELHGVGTRRTPGPALEKLRTVAADTATTYYPASSGDNVKAMLVIGEALIDGRVLPLDYDEGVRWFRRAAEWGSATAKALLYVSTGN